MAWSKSKDPFAEQSVKNTNILFSPWGKGNPASSKEYNVNFLIRSQAEQELYRSLMPSGFISRVSPITTLETTTGIDSDGELAALTTNTTPIPNVLRLGRADVIVNGWKIHVSNVDGSNGVHNNITLDTAPTTNGRVDLVFLEAWVAELGGTSASITNSVNKPTATTIYAFGNRDFRGTNVTDDISEVDTELNRRWQIQYRIRKVNGVSIDTFTDGIDDTVNVKAWGANPNNVWTSSIAGVGSVYTFSNMGNDPQFPDTGLFRAGDGSTVAQSSLGTVDGFVYAIPICAVFRRNSGIFNQSTNPLGCATGVANTGNIVSGVSGRPDGLFYDQIAEYDIMTLRHGVAASHDWETLESQAMDRLLRGNLMTYFGIGDNTGAPGLPNPIRSTLLTYTEGLSSIDQPMINDFSQYNYQRRIYSDAAVVQQTPFYFTGQTADLSDSTHFAKPFNVNAPATPTGTASTASGTLTAGTFLVKVTYTNAFGETTPSTESAGIVLGATGNITVNSPATSTGATGWNVYITSGGTNTETKQNGGTPINIGTNYTQSVPLVGGAALPGANTASSTLSIVVSSAGLTNGAATGTCIDGTATAGAGNLPGNTNILVYDASTNAAATGTWTGLGTASTVFRVTGQWSASITTNGCIAITGISYPAGNGLHFRSLNVKQQAAIIGGSSVVTSQIGVTGIAKAVDGFFNTPKDVYVDASGNIYVADTLNHRVIKYNSLFVKQAQFGVTGTSGADNTHLNNPVSVVTDSAGNVYVSDQINHRLVKLNSSLAYVGQFGVTATTGSDNAHLNTPNQVRVDGTDNLYISDFFNFRIVKISNALAFVSSPISGLANAPTGVAVDSTGTLIYLTQAHALQKYTSGSLTWTFGVIATAGADNFHMRFPQYVTIDNQPNIPQGVLVTDTGNHRVIKVNSNGIYQGQLGVTSKIGTDVGMFQSPSSVAVDANSQTYVADQNNHRIMKQHIAMGSVDAPLRQLEVFVGSATTDTLNTTYQYRSYQGMIGNQGSTPMNYTLRALTDMKFIATSLGTAGRNASTEDNLNACLVRLPLPKGAFGTTPSTPELEFKFSGANALSWSNMDATGIISDPQVSWGGGMATFGPAAGTDLATFQGGPMLCGRSVKISQNTLAAGFPSRGVNTLQKFSEFLSPTSTFDTVGLSFGTLNTSVEHLNVGYFLASCSGGASTLPLLKGEVVLVVVTFRPGVSSSTGVYTYTNVAVAIDLFRVTQRTLLRF